MRALDDLVRVISQGKHEAGSVCDVVSALDDLVKVVLQGKSEAGSV